jgi:hypothetical protein
MVLSLPALQCLIRRYLKEQNQMHYFAFLTDLDVHLLRV